MVGIVKLGLATACALAPWQAGAQTAANMAVLKGLAPVAALSKTYNGRAALAANLTVTGGIQTGAIRQPTLMPFADQQQQAIKDAFITGWGSRLLTRDDAETGFAQMRSVSFCPASCGSLGGLAKLIASRRQCSCWT